MRKGRTLALPFESVSALSYEQARMVPMHAHATWITGMFHCIYIYIYIYIHTQKRPSDIVLCTHALYTLYSLRACSASFVCLCVATRRDSILLRIPMHSALRLQRPPWS